MSSETSCAARDLASAAERRDIEALQAACFRPGGLQSAEIRRRAWPLLAFGADHDCNQIQAQRTTACGDQTPHPDRAQVELDVSRTPLSEHGKAELVDVVMTILARHNGLHYYQGFHDVCRVLLEVVFFDMAVEIGLFLAAGHLRDATTGSTLDKLSRSLDCLFPLVETRDLQLAKDLEQLDLMPHFGLQWLLTWGSHLSHEWSPVLFDAFLASEPDFQFPLYVAAAYTLSQRAAIGKLREEMGLIHQHLNSGLHLRTSSEVADVLQMAVSIRDQYPDPGVALCLSEKRKAWEAGAPKRLMIMRAAAASVPLVLAIAISYYLHNLKNS